MTERKKYTSVEEYMSEFSDETKHRLDEIRGCIKGLAPESTERISYNIPAAFIGKSIVVYYSGYERHVSLYPGKIASETLDPVLQKYFSGKSTLKFPNGQPLPMEAIEAYIAERVKIARTY
ncbi:hypothetical protein D3C85_806750 [compost metagenome]